MQYQHSLREGREELRAKGRVIINIYRSILPLLTSLPLIPSFAREEGKIGVYSKKKFSILKPLVFQGKEGKKGRGRLTVAVYLFPLPETQGKSREERREGI